MNSNLDIIILVKKNILFTFYSIKEKEKENKFITKKKTRKNVQI